MATKVCYLESWHKETFCCRGWWQLEEEMSCCVLRFNEWILVWKLKTWNSTPLEAYGRDNNAAAPKQSTRRRSLIVVLLAVVTKARTLRCLSRRLSNRKTRKTGHDNTDWKDQLLQRTRCVLKNEFFFVYKFARDAVERLLTPEPHTQFSAIFLGTFFLFTLSKSVGKLETQIWQHP